MKSRNKHRHRLLKFELEPPRQEGHCQIKPSWSSLPVAFWKFQGANTCFVWFRPDKNGRRIWLNNEKIITYDFSLTMPLRRLNSLEETGNTARQRAEYTPVEIGVWHRRSSASSSTTASPETGHHVSVTAPLRVIQDELEHLRSLY